ncbi:CBS domain-containing protein [Dethiosulfatarculus sandiegensis]|uniref:Membrane protein n=1 Tax=Dethiosulfatarculus sandiegensis TaxID=1429043 RepID=A0A0D2HQL7_9BACT|nr:CBS domain-containing protein [Dethiosulfatarculus sandiegensis]KIX12768.1 membrane protein [Dethiosulfatarculus sandiegensis]
MLKVKDIMSSNVITLKPETEITEAAKLLLKNRINGAPVVDEKGRLLGILCQSDLIAQQKRLPLPSIFTILDGYISFTSMDQIQAQVDKIAASTVKQAMTKKPVTVGPEDSIEDVAGLMVDSNYHTLPVEKDGILLGVVGKEDVLRTLMPN